MYLMQDDLGNWHTVQIEDMEHPDILTEAYDEGHLKTLMDISAKPTLNYHDGEWGMVFPFGAW